MAHREHTSDEFGKDQPVAGTPLGLGIGSEGTWATRGADDETQVTGRRDRIPGQVTPLTLVLVMAGVFAVGVALLVTYHYLADPIIAAMMR